MLSNYINEILVLITVTVAGYIYKKVMVYVKEKRAAERRRKTDALITKNEVEYLPYLRQEIGNILKRIEALEEDRKSIQAEINQKVVDELPAVDDEKHLRIVYSIIDELLFLKTGDEIDNRFILREYMGTGTMSVVWRAFDKNKQRVVALKFLRLQFVKDGSVIRQLKNTCTYMSDIQLTHFAGIKTRLQQIRVNGEVKLIYYAREFIDGVCLDSFIKKYPEKKTEIVDALIKVGEDVEILNTRGIIIRRLTPSDIIVHCNNNLSDLHLFIVDFDAILKQKKIIEKNYLQAVSEYVAPEVLYNKSSQNVRSDVFTLGRIFCFVYYGKELPSLYQMNPAELIALLNCIPGIKQVLLKATSLFNADRFSSIATFLEQLRPSVNESKTTGFPFRGTVVQEKSKVAKIFTHCFLGTLLFMTVFRPIFTYYVGVQLSDRISVAIFHGVIGSLIWSVLISGFFISYLIIFRGAKETKSEYLLSMLFCGIGGFLGGLLCAVPSIFVTNSTTLACLGWIDATNNVNPNDLWFRLHSAYHTKMLFAYPLMGLCTGMGLGLSLKYLLERAIEKQQTETWFLPVPSKLKEKKKYSVLLESLTFSLAMYWKVYVLLILPFILNGFLIFILAPSTPETALKCGGVEPIVGKRILGEAAVHLLGSFGLLIGFFYKTKTREHE